MRGAGWMLLLGLGGCGKPSAPQVTAPASAPPAHVRAPPRCASPTPIARPQALPFGFYSLPADRFAEVAHAGVTMVGPYYGRPVDTAFLDAAHAEGLQVIHAIGTPAASLDDDALLELHAQIDAVIEHPALAAWYVLPEELRPWSTSEMSYADAVRSVLEDRDPHGRPLLSYQPNHRRREQLAQASAALDVVTRGLYANFVGASTKRAWVRAGVATIRAATKHPQTSWAVLEMFAQPPETEATPQRIRASVRHDVYASLVGGLSGVLVFSGWPRANFPAYPTYLDAYLEVATELNGELALATPVLHGEPGNGIAVEQTSGPPRVDASITAMPHMLPAVALRQVLYSGAHWLYAVNSAEEAVTLRITSPCAVSTVLGPALSDEQLRLPPLGVVVLRAPQVWLTDNDLHVEPAGEPGVAPTDVGSAREPVP